VRRQEEPTRGDEAGESTPVKLSYHSHTERIVRAGVLMAGKNLALPASCSSLVNQSLH